MRKETPRVLYLICCHSEKNQGIISCFLASFAMTTDEVEHPWCLFSRGDYLCVLGSNFSISPSTRRYPTREYDGAVSA